MDEFDVVVIGSGFGGAVTAERVAAAGFSVCVLERGRAYPPGSFPRTQHDEPQPSGTRATRPLRDVQRVVVQGHKALVSAGLGGGSLIYANVLLRKDERWFDNAGTGRCRPLAGDAGADLDPHYDAVERVLQPQVFPMQHAPYDKVTKAA